MPVYTPSQRYSIFLSAIDFAVDVTSATGDVYTINLSAGCHCLDCNIVGEVDYPAGVTVSESPFIFFLNDSTTAAMLAPVLHAVPAQNPPLDADEVVYLESASGLWTLVKSTWLQIKAFLKTYFDTLYWPLTTLFPGLTGDGSDGNVTIAANTTLTRDMMYNDLTINAGQTLYTAGYTIRVFGTLLNNGTISVAGGNGLTGANAGVAGGAPAYIYSIYLTASPATGGAGALAAAAGVNNGGAGAAGTGAVISLYAPLICYAGSGGGGGGNHAAVAVAGGAGLNSFCVNPFGFFTGGAGGAGVGGGSARLGGGSGGAGGGVLDIWTNILNNNGVFTVAGGNGGAGLTSGANKSGNGGGGGGGILLVHYKTLTGGGLGTLTVAGGLAGVGGNGGAAGGNGYSSAVQF